MNERLSHAKDGGYEYVKLAKMSSPDTIVCPHCGDIYLHQTSVTIGDRNKEDGDGIGIHVSLGDEFSRGEPSGGDIKLSIMKPNNFIGRRQELIIEFSCEHCDGCPSLAIWQHKGLTLMGWLP